MLDGAAAPTPRDATRKRARQDSVEAPQPGGQAHAGFVPLDESTVVDFVAAKPHLAERLGGAATKTKWKVCWIFAIRNAVTPCCMLVMLVQVHLASSAGPCRNGSPHCTCLQMTLKHVTSFTLCTSFLVGCTHPPDGHNALLGRSRRWGMATSTTCTSWRGLPARCA